MRSFGWFLLIRNAAINTELRVGIWQAGGGSGSGSYFWAVLWIWICRIRKFLGLLDRDPSIFVRVWIRILPSSSKKRKKKPWFIVLCDFFTTFILKTKGNNQNNLFFVGILKATEQDPKVSDTDPWIRIRIRTKISRIHNTAFDK